MIFGQILATPTIPRLRRRVASKRTAPVLVSRVGPGCRPTPYMAIIIDSLGAVRLSKHIRARFLIGIIAVATCAPVRAVTPLPSADGQFWDIQDTSAWAQDSGGIATGGRTNPFNGFGYLKLQVRRPDDTLLCRNRYLHGFDLAFDGGERFDSITPLFVEAVVVSR